MPMRERSSGAEIAEGGFDSLALHFVRAGAAGIRGGDQSADAGAGDKVYWYLIFLERAQDADVRDTAREPASECESDERTAAIFGIGERSQPLYSSMKPFCCVAQRAPQVP